MKDSIKKKLLCGVAATLFAPGALSAATFEDIYIQPDENTYDSSDRYYFLKDSNLGDLGSIEITLPGSNNNYGLQSNGYEVIQEHTATPQNDVVYYHINYDIEGYDPNGGAITNIVAWNAIDADFVDVKTKKNNVGAIYNTGIIGTVAADFIGCSSEAAGGAVYNYGTINRITGDYFGNHVGNGDVAYGGAIYNSGIINHITANFINNYSRVDTDNGAAYGGAVYNNGTGGNPGIMTFEALTDDIMFTNNKSEIDTNYGSGGAIYNAGGTINLNADAGHKITFETYTDTIENIGDASVININRTGETGKVEIKSELINHGTVNIGGGEVYIENYLDNGTLEGSTLNLIDGHAGELTINYLEASGKLLIDWEDAIVINNKSFENIYINVDEVVFAAPPNIGDDKEITGVKADEHDIYSYVDNKKYTLTRTYDKITVSNSEDLAGLEAFLQSNGKNYAITNDLNVTGEGDAPVFGSNEKAIYGHGYAIHGYAHGQGRRPAFLVGNNNSQTLSINDVSVLDGFATSDERPATITMENGSVLNVNAIYSDVELGGSPRGASSVSLSFIGSNNTANLTAGVNRLLSVSGDVVSESNANIINLKGPGTIRLTGNLNTVTVRNYADTLRSGETVGDNAVTWELYDGTLRYASDAYFGDNKNVVNFYGGTLDIANGAVNDIKLHTLNLNAHSNIVIDLDATAGKTDTIAAKSFVFSMRAPLNVSGFNIMNPVRKSFFADFLSESAGNYDGSKGISGYVTTSVAQADKSLNEESSVFKYDVTYREDDATKTGRFYFTYAGSHGTSGGGSAKNTTVADDFSAFNAIYGNHGTGPNQTEGTPSGNSLTFGNGAAANRPESNLYIIGGAAANAAAKKNTVTIQHLDADVGLFMDVYGGMADDADAIENAVAVAGGDFNAVLDIYGGSAIPTKDAGNALNAKDNTVAITGGDFGGSVTIAGGYVLDAGRANKTFNVTSNSVTIEGGKFNAAVDIYGGLADLSGSNSKATVTGNTVEVKCGAFNGGARIYGGRSNAGEVSGNEVILSGGEFTSGYNLVVGGKSDIEGAVKNNTVRVYGNVDLKNVYLVAAVDEHYDNPVKSGGGNKLVFGFKGTPWMSSSGEIDSIKGFDAIQIDAAQWDKPIRVKSLYTDTAKTGKTAVDATKVAFAGVDSVKKGDKTVLLKVSDLIYGTGFELEKTASKYTIGTTLEGNGTVSIEGDDYEIAYTIDSAKPKPGPTPPGPTPGPTPQPQTHAAAMGMAASVAALNQGADTLGAGMKSLSSAGQGGMAGFAVMGGGTARQETGSHVTLNAFNLATGLGSNIDAGVGMFTVGGAFETGYGSFKNHFDAGDADRFVRKNGHIAYYGGAATAEMKWNSLWHMNGALRAGYAKSEQGNALYNPALGVTYDIDIASYYLGSEFGGGRTFKLNEQNAIDLYAKYFYLHKSGDDFYAGGEYDVKSVDSHRLRAGTRYDLSLGQRWGFYAGLAYEYEFDGESRLFVDGVEAEPVKTKGGRAYGELGVKLVPEKDAAGLSLDFNVKGVAGSKYRDVLFGVDVKYMF